jgi:peptidyl-prolyl cis-trans isomerase SurA
MSDLIKHLRPAVCSTALVVLGLGVLCWPSLSPQVAAQTTASKDDAKNTKPGRRAASGEQGILALVNDEPITAYAVEQRARFISMSAGAESDFRAKAEARWARIMKDPGTNERFQKFLREKAPKSKEEVVGLQKEFIQSLQRSMVEQLRNEARVAGISKYRKQAQEELIDERLKIQAAKKLGIEVTDAEVNTIVKSLADRNKMTNEQFAQHMKGMGVDITTLSERFRAQKAWRDLISRRYAAQVSVTQRDVDRMISSSALESGDDTTELHLHKITLSLPSKIDQAALIKRYAEAETLRRKYRNCTTMAELAKGVSEARFTDMKFVKPSAIPEPTRTMLLGAKDGDMLPPATTASGVEVYALCGRRAVAGNEAARTKALQELQTKELEVLARRHMRNLRQEADIEHR